MWQPCKRIAVYSALPTLRIRGMDSIIAPQWPDAYQNSSADYTIDFNEVVCADDWIVAADFATTAGNVAWVSISGTLASAWIEWTSSGLQSATATIQTASGAILSATASLSVVGTLSLIQPDLPAFSPNALVCGDAYMADANGNILLAG